MITTLLLCTMVAAPGGAVSDLKADEWVTVLPAYAHRDKAGRWAATLHVWVYEPETDSASRGAALGALRRTLGLDPDAAESKIFRRRARMFMVDNERRKTVRLDLAGQRVAVGPTEPNGHATRDVAFDAPPDQPLTADVALRPGDSRAFQGTVHPIGPTGLSVICDIDDTLKHSDVRDTRRLLERTFLKEFEIVDGVPALLGRLEQRGAVFHYVSSSPWQLYGEFDAFFKKENVPAGTFHLKTFRVADGGFEKLFASPEKTKPKQINPILDDFAGRRFVLIGDTGEKDPEVYGQLARDRPDQVALILLRNTTSEKAGNPRMAAAMQGVPAARWVLFDEAKAVTLPDSLVGDDVPRESQDQQE